jgi:mRNA interferase RelE/StbE/toxin YoeB
MAYALEVSERADRIFRKLAKKNRALLSAIDKKVQQILENPHHFKPLRGDMHGARRVHIDASFVLIYEIDEARQVVRLLDYEHHDKIYG